MSTELINMRVPFISVPLPSSADDHQLKMLFYKKKRVLLFNRGERLAT